MFKYFYPQLELCIFSLCLWHLIQVLSTNPENNFNIKVYRFQQFTLLPVDLFLETPNPKTSRIPTQTCSTFKTVRLELCPKPIQKKSQFSVFPNTEMFFFKNEACLSQKPSLRFQKSVTDFSKVGGSFPQSRWLIFPKVGDGFPQSRWLISPKSVAHFPKVCDGFPQSR